MPNFEKEEGDSTMSSQSDESFSEELNSENETIESFYVSEEETDISEIEKIRLKNIRDRENFLNFGDEFQDGIDIFNSDDNLEDKENVITKKKRIIKRQGDSTFRFFGNIPTERRKSARISKTNPKFESLENHTERSFYDDYDEDDEYDLKNLEKKIYRPTKRKASFKSPRVVHKVLPVEDVTEQMLKNISTRVKGKKYSQDGTSCHQCRQKTLDQKTCCRNPNCVGVQGQFCGVCIKNRYGEDARVALKDPNWTCFPCRGLCNCSFCRKKQGKRPTGILAPIAHRLGHQSVAKLLESLNGEGDFIDDEDEDTDIKMMVKPNRNSNKNSKKNNSDNNDLESLFPLLGFTSDGKMAFEIPDREKELLGFDSKGKCVFKTI